SPPDPIRIGFIGGLNGRVADLGEGGRNGVQLAVEEKNRAGGIAGRRIELLVRDDGQKPEQAEQAAQELIASGVVAIVGPMTSAMAASVLKVTEPAGVTVVSPTVTARDFSGRDDLFFQVMPNTTREARMGAKYHLRKGIRKVVAIADHANSAYTQSWLEDFRQELVAGGGAVAELAFNSGQKVDDAAVVEEALASHPDAIVVLASAVDAGRLAQQIRRRNARLPMLTSMWAGTDKLIELGGGAVEGMTMHQYFDRMSTAPRYIEFQARYQERFKQPSGFPGMAGYDAAQAVLEALERRRAGTSLKESLLQNGPFSGVQGEVRFNATGDSERAPSVAVIRNGRFVMAD
ncbi:MAG TPA: ABC transporter substrate-binding protein, partial [Rhodocyclaceae bacterium]|nr:ABC transporter substrate-binding protein [Rhodocyclaceae bacterium]